MFSLNFASTNGTFSNSTASSSITTNATSSNLFAGKSFFTESTSTSLFATNGFFTNATSSTGFFNAFNALNGTSTNFFADIARINYASSTWISADKGFFTDLDVSATTTARGLLRATGAVVEAVQGIDRIDIGIEAGSPRLVFENAGASTPVWEVDNDAGNFRWFTPGFVQMNLSQSGNAATLDINNNNTSKIRLAANGDSYISGGRLAVGGTAASTALTVVGTTTTDGLEVLGSAYSNSATWNVFSDARVKKDVAEYKDGLDLIVSIDPKVFSYNGLGGTANDGKRHVGIIAQDVVEKAPYMFTKVMKKLNNEDATETELYVYNGGTDLIYALVNAVKELNGKLTGTYNDAVLWTKGLKADKVEAKVLCVEDVCVTKEQFMRMVQQSGVQPQSAPQTGGSESTPVVSTTTEEVVSPETSSTPEENITPVPSTPVEEVPATN
jgi:hypothetical protein